ncbi:hypothetical protein Sjap_019210 [Stephania japonica]|uniref:Dynein light chain n=1 Tax=Stephania japonica TaxID=461633 RepID=A0AAP0HZ48_9MAGN
MDDSHERQKKGSSLSSLSSSSRKSNSRIWSGLRRKKNSTNTSTSSAPSDHVVAKQEQRIIEENNVTNISGTKGHNVKGEENELVDQSRKPFKGEEKILDDQSKKAFKGEEMRMLVDQARKSVSHVETNLGSVASFLHVKVLAVDMPGYMQVHAFKCARRTFDSLEKFSSKHMAYNIKKEFDRVYGPAWHCIVGSSFGSFVTYSTGCFLYFSMEKIYILLFKTKVQKSSSD